MTLAQRALLGLLLLLVWKAGTEAGNARARQCPAFTRMKQKFQAGPAHSYGGWTSCGGWMCWMCWMCWTGWRARFPKDEAGVPYKLHPRPGLC